MTRCGELESRGRNLKRAWRFLEWHGGGGKMATLYNRIQGRNLERLAALSDGIFAVAMTLLVLDLYLPAAAQVHSESELWAALCAMAPQWVTYGMSFLTLGIFWAGQQTQLNHIGGSRIVLAEYSCAGHDAVLELGVRCASGVDQAGHAGRGEGQHLPAYLDCAIAVCGRSGAMPRERVGEHCGDCAGAVELCDCAAIVERAKLIADLILSN